MYIIHTCTLYIHVYTIHVHACTLYIHVHYTCMYNNVLTAAIFLAILLATKSNRGVERSCREIEREGEGERERVSF